MLFIEFKKENYYLLCKYLVILLTFKKYKLGMIYQIYNLYSLQFLKINIKEDRNNIH